MRIQIDAAINPGMVDESPEIYNPGHIYIYTEADIYI
jgi:hypothetical protein